MDILTDFFCSSDKKNNNIIQNDSFLTFMNENFETKSCIEKLMKCKIKGDQK